MADTSESIRPTAGQQTRIGLLVRGREDLRPRLIWLTLARLVVATILLTITLAFGAPITGASPTMHGVLAVVLAIFACSIVYALALLRTGDLRLLGAVQIALDMAAWLALVYVTGGPASPMSFFFGLSTLTAALVLGARAARITAVIAIGLYGTLVVTMTAGWLHPLADAARRTAPPASELAFQLVANTLGVLVIAALGSNLASRLSRAGGALARSEASHAALAGLYEDVLRSIPVALLTCKRTGVIDGANPGAAMLFDVPVDALLNTPITQWLPFLSADAFSQGAQAQHGDETLTVLPTHPRIAYRAAPLFDREGKIRGGLVVIEDRSDTEALREAVHNAERLASLGRLAAGLAHEIRNPLGAISSGVELVCESDALQSEDKSLLATALREVTRLNNLVSDMLSFAKPRAPDVVPTDLAATARDVVALARTTANQTPVVWQEPTTAKALPLVQGDPDQIRQVIWNLVRNAMQVSPQGASVDVLVREVNDGVELAVADRGPGISPELRERVFDVFYSERARGTGLGLAIVKQIATAHGARIDVRARSGGGTEFAVVFHRAAQENKSLAS